MLPTDLLGKDHLAFIGTGCHIRVAGDHSQCAAAWAARVIDDDPLALHRGSAGRGLLIVMSMVPASGLS